MISTVGRWGRRLIGAALIVVVTVPLWRLLAEQTGPVAAQVAQLSERYAVLLVRGTVVVVILGLAAGFALRPAWYERWLADAGERLASLPGPGYALVLAAVAGAATAGLSLFIWGGMPPITDAWAQLIHARYFAGGRLAGPADLPFEFWTVANTFMTDGGWVSQYPPGHPVLLAMGLWVGAAWLVGPVVMAAAVLFTTLAADRLWPNDRGVARLGSLLFAVSPFLLTVAAGYMNHVTAAALLAVAAYTALRARDDHWGFAVPSGCAIGLAFATRPLTALVAGAAVTVGAWVSGWGGWSRPAAAFGTRLTAAAAGAFPAVLLVAAYNARFFGSPFRFGYLAYLGPRHQLGFHPDPFGNTYQPIDALGYLSADLLALGRFLWQTPISAVLVVGILLLTARHLSGGTRLATAWALVLIPPLALYWHHDLFFGPRMISDVAPAWCLLTVVGVAELIRSIPADGTWLGGRFSPRSGVTVMAVGALAIGLTYIAPLHLRNYARRFGASHVAPPVTAPSLVFVHDSWNARLGARMVALNMRADSVSTALGRNSTCALHTFATADNGRAASARNIVFAPNETDGSEPTRLPSGAVIRARPGERLSPSCQREADADRFGAIPLMPFLWQGDLPGLAGSGAMFVRDMGPETNSRLVTRFPTRRPLIYLRQPDRGPALVPYDEGMALLWGASLPDSVTGAATIRR